MFLPGVPVAQGRPRIVRWGNKAGLKDPENSREWKGAAAWQMTAAMRQAGLMGPLTGPLAIFMRAVWPLPKGKQLKRGTRPAAWRTSKPDVDNVGKSTFDAGNGILWEDDAQIVRVIAEKINGAQGEPPGIHLSVFRLADPP